MNTALFSLIGSWRLTSFVLQEIGKEPVEPFGPDAKGTLVLTANGRWVIVVTAQSRKPATNAEERAALLDTLLAYTGRYTVDGDQIMTKIDACWNEVFTGSLQNQVRFFQVEGDKLIVRTPEIDSAVRPGKRVAGTLTWEREP